MGDITRKMASQLVEDPDLKEFAKAVSLLSVNVSELAWLLKLLWWGQRTPTNNKACQDRLIPTML